VDIVEGSAPCEMKKGTTNSVRARGMRTPVTLRNFVPQKKNTRKVVRLDDLVLCMGTAWGEQSYAGSSGE
jgi:hypothetical protein